MSENGRNDQRREPRHTLRAEACIEPLNDRLGLGERFDVTLCDASRTGLMLLSGQAMDIGSRWRVRLSDQGDCVATVPVVVRHCFEEGGGYYVGCQVVLEPFLMRWLGITPTDADAPTQSDHWLLTPPPSR